ncbi:hypothetical protein SPAR37_0712 [Streptococcus pneumoniae GA14798]|nr:hypothetical protein SPAR37_0712 [Streptococcus pneumoniae GA14798]
MQTLTSVPSSPFLACSTQVGLTQTLAKSYSLASDNKLSICFSLHLVLKAYDLYIYLISFRFSLHLGDDFYNFTDFFLLHHLF